MRLRRVFGVFRKKRWSKKSESNLETVYVLRDRKGREYDYRIVEK